ncbi:hypothetical protein M9H77_23517 [Catharanthus roseus]|uniref:Uncharacterized protein n=1 Tax=Catharanthus roseus TaxID=4058 RepID=A0ACC0ATH5_CATRO|nr:hypothetical protein M9H77_23517 [Catharanthus roseus]
MESNTTVAGIYVQGVASERHLPTTERFQAFYLRVWCLSSSLPMGFPLKSSMSVTRNLNRAPSKPIWQDVKEFVRSLQLQLNSVKKNLGNIWREDWTKGNMNMQRVDAMGILDIKNMNKVILTTKLDKVVGLKNEMMGRDFRVGYESYEGFRYSYMDGGYAHWYPYEQEARYYGKETYESQESMKSFL